MREFIAIWNAARNNKKLSLFAGGRTYGQMRPEDDGGLLRQHAENQSNEAFATLVARHINLVFGLFRGTAQRKWSAD